MVDTSNDTVVCCSCGKVLKRDNPEAEHIEYIYDRDTEKVVCIECYNYKDTLLPPDVYLFPENETVWVTTMFSGTDSFGVEWVEDSEYLGHWVMHSDQYEQLDVEDIEAKEKELQAKGTPYAKATMIGKSTIWIKK